MEARKAVFDKQDQAKLARLAAEEMLKQDITAFLHEYHVADDVNKPSIQGQL